MSVKLLHLHEQPLLGRVHAVNRKHRLRCKHYDEIGDWPESGACVDVLPGAALDGVDHFPCVDQVLVVSQKLLGVLRSVDAEVQSFPIDAGGRTVHVVLPRSDDDVSYEADGSPVYSENGYTVLEATNLRASEEPPAAFCGVRNTGLLALSDQLVAAAQAAGVRWTPRDVIESYAIERRHPYLVLGSNNTAMIKKVVATSDWPAVASDVAHPLGARARDENLDGDPDEAWRELVENTGDVAKAAVARYCSGLPLPSLAGYLDEDIAKSKLKKRWKETTSAGCAAMNGLPCVSASVRDLMLAAGVEASFMPVSVTDRALEQTITLYLLNPGIVLDWIDWSKSDVGLRWNGMMDEYFDLEPTEASYASTIPVVRVAGSNLVLVHESLASQLTAESGFHLTPLHEQRVGRNLDDCIRAT